MNTSKKSILSAAALLGISSPLLMTPGAARAEDFSNPAVNAYWAESWTDATGLYNSPDQTHNSVTGGQLVATIPTDASLLSPDNEVVNYVRTRTDLPGAATYYDGSLLGDLSSKSSVSATFSLNNSTLTPGEQFQASEFVGEGTGPQLTAPPDLHDPSGYPYNSGTPSPSLRLVFTGGGADGEWWSTSGISATTMNNGQAVTTSVNFDPSAWSDINGQNGLTNVAGFDAALSSVQYLGVSFGSGFFYSDGFGFDTGGTASLNISSVATVPEPASLSLIGIGSLALLRRRSRKA